MKKTNKLFTLSLVVLAFPLHPAFFSLAAESSSRIDSTTSLEQETPKMTLPSMEDNSEIEDSGALSQTTEASKMTASSFSQNIEKNDSENDSETSDSSFLIHFLTDADFPFKNNLIATTIAKKNKASLFIRDMPHFSHPTAASQFLYWQDVTSLQTYSYGALRHLESDIDISLRAVFNKPLIDNRTYGISNVPTPPDFSSIKAMPNIFHDPISGSGNVGPELSADYKTLLITPQKSNSKDKSALGAIWSKKKLNINKDFEFKAFIYLGNAQKKAGDGITFTLHNDPRGEKALGSDGSGIGAYSGNGGNQSDWIRNAISIEFDTYYNNGSKDPMDGDLNKNGERGHVAVVTPSADNNRKGQHSSVYYPGDYLSNGKWRQLIVSWSAQNKTLTYDIPGGTTKSYYISNPEAQFGGNFVHWGFTGSTGGNSSDTAVAVTQVPSTITHEVSIKNKTTGEGDYATQASARPKATLSFKNHIVLDDSSPTFAEDATISANIANLEYVPESMAINGHPIPSENISYENDLLSVNLKGLTEAIGQTADLTFDARLVSDTVDTQYSYHFTYHEDGVLSDSNAIDLKVPYLSYQTFNIHYLDMDGNEIQPSQTRKEVIGDHYKITPLDIDGFIFNKDSGNTEGTVSTNLMDVTFYYQKGTLAIKEAPSLFDFKDQKISNKTETYWPTITGKMIIADTRGPQSKKWRLTIKETQPLTDTSNNQSLTNIFNWANGSSSLPVTKDELTIFQSSQTGETILSNNWGQEYNTGIHLIVPVEKQLKGHYSGQLTWRVIDAP